MACYKAAVIFGLLLCVSVCAGELQLSGHETPVYVGLSRVVTCEWIGSETITKLEWYLVVGDGSGLGMKFPGVDDTTLLMTGHIVDISWNGRKYMCQANLTSGEPVNKTFSLWVKEAKNEIKITPSYVPCGDNHNLMAGDNHILTCIVNSEFPANLKWIRNINEMPDELENTPNITVSKQSVSDEITKRSITFNPLLTLHAGKYKCVSVLTNMGPKLLSTQEEEHEIYVKIPPPTVKLISDNEAITSKNFSLTALINIHPTVDTPIVTNSSWNRENEDIDAAPRVTIINSNSSSVVQFAPLISSDGGTYYFSTRVRALDSKYLCPSSLVNDSIDISPSLFVAIDVTYTPPDGFNLKSPPYYKTNTDVTFTCRVEGAHGDIKYQWSSTAMRELPADSHSQTLTIIMVNSYDDGNYTCNAMDAKGNTGSDTTVVEVIGLNVSIKVEYYHPVYGNWISPQSFRAASYVTLTCQVTGAKGKFQYLWNSTNPNSFVLNNRSSNLARAIITSDDAGSHTCIVMDDDNNTGSSTIEMNIEGGGIFVLKSKSHNNVAVVNNDMITIDSRSRIIDFICYTDSSDSDDWYIILPNNTQYKKSQQVRRIPPSGIQFQNNNTRLRVNPGIYTCRLRYSNGKNISYNLAVSTSARAPYIYYNRYTDHSKNESNTLLGVIEIKTRNSPPTNVTCKRDGEIVVSYPYMKKDGYEVMQVVTDRSRSYYTTYIQIRNCCDLVGRNDYTCTVENSAGRHSRTIRTNMEVETDLSLKNTTEPVYNETFVLTCTATITPTKPAGYLFQETQIEWVGPDGNVSKNSSGIIVGDQVVINNTATRTLQATQTLQATRTLTFSSLNYGHEGEYTCRIKCVESTQSFTIKVIERTILQLKFGPLPHCSNWYKDKRISTHVEHDLTKFIEKILLKDCDNYCTLHHRLLTEQRFSCQTSTSCVTFRAYLIGSKDTRSLRDMLYALYQWLVNDNTFLYNYNSRIRLRADRECPLTIDSFYEPECKGRECLFRQGMNLPTVERHPYVHLFG